MELAVVAQLLVAANLADDGIIGSVPALALHIFRWCLIAGAIFTLSYTWQSTRNTIGLTQKNSEQKHEVAAMPVTSPTGQLA